VITAPEKSMALIAALVEQLDTLPSARAQIKVFTIVNGDATALAQMLQQLLSTQSQTAQGGNTLFGQGTLSPFLQPALQSAAGLGESTLVPVRFGVDQRTNSIIVTGSEGDLGVVEAVLLRLDEADFQQRKTTVYWLANAPATEVAAAVDEWLADRDAIYDEQLNISPLSPDIILNREVIVVPEAVSNSIIISATPEWFDEVSHVVQALDRRLPLVKIDMLIVEVELNDEFEFGAEFGLQDSLLYDRAYSNGDLPGYNFNNEPLGDRDGNRGNVLGQALSAFNLLRESTQLGYGGLVLSASRDSVSVLIRALQEDSRAQILSRPHITTLDSQPASVFVGTLTARPGETVLNANQAVTSINEFNVGLELGVTPRVTPDGLVIMEVDVTKSRISEDSVEIDGNVIQNINTLETFTTIAARSGQTVVFTGLIDTTEVTQVRGIPYLSRLPVVGPLFSFTRDVDNRTELLIIMTPHVIQCDEEVDWFVFSESERMSWCASDVMELYGELQITARPGEWCKPDCCETPVIFPDMNPMGLCANPAYPTGAEPIPGRPQGLLLPPPTAEPGVSPPLAEPEPDDQAGAPVPRAARLSPQTSQPLRPPATFSERPAGYQPAWEGANTAPAPVGPPPVGPPPSGGYDAANAALWAGEHAAPHGVVPSANVEPSRTAPPEAYLRRFPQAN
jgi:type II secretory pathway component GspD/PulD (secretin)